MTRAQRVFKAINHEPVDRVPKGEWQLTDGLIRALQQELGVEPRMEKEGGPLLPAGLNQGSEGEGEARWAPVSREERAQVLELLEMDFLAFVTPAGGGPAPAPILPDEVGWWRTHTDFFLWAVVDGPFQGTARHYELMDFLLRVATRDQAVFELVPKFARAGLEAARRYLEAGVHGIIIGDDVAYNSGTYIRPALWREVFWPWLRFMVEELRRDDPSLPIFFHSDGDIRAILPDLVEAGFSGLHGLEASAGMDLGQLWAEYGRRICLMGNLDYQWLASPRRAEELEDQVRGLLSMAGRGGGYIFGSSAGILDDGVRAANLITVYRYASRYGR
ncbi:MAG: hypothetical protein H5U02_05705 [Clostridia bacterium]|nr:hypothetical protein [Clostridia bacterium]